MTAEHSEAFFCSSTLEHVGSTKHRPAQKVVEPKLVADVKLQHAKWGGQASDSNQRRDLQKAFEMPLDSAGTLKKSFRNALWGH